MNFKASKLPSYSKEMEYYWNHSIKSDVDFRKIDIDGKQFDFTEPVDYFNLTAENADLISYGGRPCDFFSQQVALQKFEMNIFGNLSSDTQIGGLLSNVAQHETSSEAYCIYATFEYINKSVYCAFTVGIANDDSGMEQEVAVLEIGQDETAYICPIEINDEALYFYTLDDIAKIGYWLGNFWVGIQNKMNHCPEEVRIVEPRNMQDVNNDEYRNETSIVLVKHIVFSDENGNIVNCGSTGTGKKYMCPSWGVRGHYRTLADGRVIMVHPYKKGKERKNPHAFVKKEYRLDE